MYRIRPYTAADRPAWNDFIRRSRNGVFLFQREYMDYHADRFEDASVIVESAQGTPRIVAVLPANRRHTPDGDHCVTHGGLTFGGLVMDEKLGGAQVLAVMEMSMRAAIGLSKSCASQGKHLTDGIHGALEQGRQVGHRYRWRSGTAQTAKR